MPIDDIYNLDMEKFATATCYLLVSLGVVVAIGCIIFQWFGWHNAIKYITLGVIFSIFVGGFVLRVIYTIKKK